MGVLDLFIIAIDEPQRNRLRLQYMPRQISYNRSAKFDSIPIIGRNEPLHHFSGGETKLNFAIDFYSDDEQGAKALQGIQFLESMQYSGKSRPPSRLQIVMGRLFRGKLWLLTDLSVNYSVFEGGKEWQPRYAVANCTFSLDTEQDIFSDDVRVY